MRSRYQPAIQTPDALSGEHYWLAIQDGRVLLVETGEVLPLPLFRSFGLTGLDTDSRHYLGQLDGKHLFAVEVRAGQAAPAGMYFEDLRRLLASRDPLLFGLASRARQIVAWRQDHRFCSRCGAGTEPHVRDRAMVCTACSYTQYPRQSPCVIVLVTRGDDVLLARSANFPRGMFSTLAGFIEAGESVEEALAREVHEEVGVVLREPRYVASQSWPFPNSLMLGFHAEWAGGDIVVDGEEIVEAGWFSIQDLPMIPPQGSISRRLIDSYVAQRTR
jgi:NAD+ diphosphatase